MTISLKDGTISDLVEKLQVNYSLIGVRKMEHADFMRSAIHIVC